MRGKVFIIICLTALLGSSCGNKSESKHSSLNAVLQDADGTLALNLENAACYSDGANPSSNTAEWNIVVTKSGRFKVWLSSATKDTTNLGYVNSVKITLLDKQLEVNPVTDKVILNSDDVALPYFRADSYAGSFYISEPGEYSIQLISEKVLSADERKSKVQAADDTRLMSVILSPMTR